MEAVPQICEKGLWEFETSHAFTIPNQEKAGRFCNPPLGHSILLFISVIPLAFKKTLNGNHLFKRDSCIMFSSVTNMRV
jgi:hypothetical protein